MKNACPVCGYDGLNEPAYTDGEASFDICPCCGVQFGYGDASIKHDVLRARWIDNGMRWSSDSPGPPPDWDPIAQLRKAKLTQ